ncbi:hypothetical protein PLEOSDRAFT_1092525 [Pleurotus ostreatus PC15]|uniref:SMP-LTD domain-containing protein n=1 Tax=Pleurotus ostreatus (strain PC15) TaxID=1137138 RepID=A0A067NT85_PLEO1|nr:hypothetical protein PLEOSDRAFT_1092525 [Pleurotus ostreatus PC15]
MCGQAISPVYRGIQGILMEDIDRVAEVLSQVGYDRDEEDNVHDGRCTSDKFPEKPRRKRRRSSNTDRCLPLIIPSTHPSAPTIIITPCPPESLMTDSHALVYAYVLGGLTFIPLVLAALVFFTIYTSVPVGDPDPSKQARAHLERDGSDAEDAPTPNDADAARSAGLSDVNDIPRTRKGWLTMRRTFEESPFEGSYVTLVRSFLDARSKDPKRSRPKDMWYVVLKGKVLYLYEDEAMTECEVAVELSGFEVIVYPEGQLDGELFAKRNAICLRARGPPVEKGASNPSTPTSAEGGNAGENIDDSRSTLVEGDKPVDTEKDKDKDKSNPWFIFVRTNVEMEDWYFALIHASEQPAQAPTLAPLQSIFSAADMQHLVTTLDEQPDVIPMRWLNALIGRIFFSFYRTHHLEAYIIGRLMKKLSKVKRPGFLTDVVVKEVSVGNRPPTLSKPMLKELTKEGDAALEVHLQFKGEIRITVEATATINLGARFKPYNVKLVLAAVVKEMEGNLLVKVKRPPSNRIWYAFTQTPRMVISVEPIVSDRQITWTMILSTIEARLKEIIQESVVMPNMDDIAFFESSPYEHRGGIWSDASRHEVPASLLLNRDPASVEMLSTASAPATTDLDGSLTKDESNLATPVPPEVTSVQSVPTTLPSDMPEDAMGNGSINGRRRTWFSGIRNDDFSALLPSQLPDAVDGDRGRTTDSASTNGTRQERSHSRHSARANTQDSSDLEAPAPVHQSAISRPRSRQSFHEKGLSVSSDGSGAYTDGSALSAASSRNAEASSSKMSNLPSSPASPTGFLSQLKSRATDKQALSNTAKEAMKKWGMNWAGLRKDSSKDREGSSGDTSGNEDQPDHGVIGATRAMFDPNGSMAQRARASYAEVRAAVAERREKERKEAEEERDTGASERRFLGVHDRTTSSSSSPIPIPDGGKTRARQSSASDQETILRVGSEASDKSIPVPSTSAPSASPINIDEDEEIKPTSPIHRQPQAMSMTIPGIHPSHRGDVLSMGYVASEAPPSTPNTKDKEGAGSKIKLPQNPTIQSMYTRFWKSPGGSVTGSPSSTPSRPGSSAHPIDPNNPFVDRLNAPAAPPPSMTSRVPPPLPPRSTPTAVSRAPVEPSQPSPSSTLNVTELPGPESSTSPAKGSASEALKSIATKDENIRTKRASQELSTNASPQPSPPRPASRRISTSLDTSSTDESLDSGFSKGIVADGNIDEHHERTNDSNDDEQEDSLPTPTPPPHQFRNSNPGPPLPPRRIPEPIL